MLNPLHSQGLAVVPIEARVLAKLPIRRAEETIGAWPTMRGLPYDDIRGPFPPLASLAGHMSPHVPSHDVRVAIFYSPHRIPAFREPT